MDGIAVSSDHRGQGIGTGLLAKLKDFGLRNGYDLIRLDVVDTNDRARDLYLRLGFRPGKHSSYEFLRPELGFGGSTEMTLPLS